MTMVPNTHIIVDMVVCMNMHQTEISYLSR